MLKDHSGVLNELKIEQNFQKIQGHVKVGDAFIPFKEAKLQADKIGFIIEQSNENGTQTWVFEGRTTGHTLEGILRIDQATTVKWKAIRNPQTMKPLDPGGPLDFRR